MKPAGPRVAVVSNQPCLPADHPDAIGEADVVNVANAVASALAESDFEPVLVPAAPPLCGFVQRLESTGADLVFSLVEGFGGRSELSTHLTSIFELLGLPYTGASVEGLVLCQSKVRTKHLLQSMGLPVTPSVLLGPGQFCPVINWTGPSIVKPDHEDGSVGIDQSSVVTDTHKLMAAVDRLRERYHGPLLVEPYLPGPEFNVGVIADPEPRALPVAQVMFDPRPGEWPILTYAAKWHEGSAEDLGSPISCPAPIDAELAAKLSAIAVVAFRVTSCRDYARVDIRISDEGTPSILEVNPNPDLGPTAGWARAARVLGMTYVEAVTRIATQARMRGRRPV